MVKKGQAAMEFLMTYGWAILVVLAAIGALAYFGVLSPDNILPERTSFQAPLSNVDTAYISGGTAKSIEIAFSNNVGYQINVTDGNISDIEVANSDETCTAVAMTTPSAAVDNNDRFTVKWACTSGSTWDTGDRLKATLTFTYVNMYTNQTRATTGTVNGKIS